MQETVLVVDDNPVNVALMDRLLRHRSLNVVSATDGPGALAAAEVCRPDLILVDVQMPGMDGIALTRHLKANPATASVPVVLVTAYSDVEERERGLEAGADDVVTKPVNPRELWTRLQTLLRLGRQNVAVTAALQAMVALVRRIEERNPFTAGRCERLAAAGVALGTALQLDSEECEGLRQAAVVCDIGKAGIPDEILLKPGPLNPAEWARVREHPVVGAAICAPVKAWAPAIPIIRHRHEKMDGSGYPDALRGEAIPRAARVFAVVAVYDALTHPCPWRPAMTPAQAMATLTEEAARGWWDPAVVAAWRSLAESAVEAACSAG